MSSGVPASQFCWNPHRTRQEQEAGQDRGKGKQMSTVVMHSVVSVDGYIADETDQVGPLFDWYSNGDTALTEGGWFKVSQASAEYVRPMWDSIGSMVIGRHLFDITNGWEGKPPAGEHVVVVSHRPKPDRWHPEASYHFVADVAQAVAKAKELAGERIVAVAAGHVGGQAFALGLVDEVAMDVVPVVFGSGKRYFGPVGGQHLLEDPDVVIRGDRVLHLRYRVRR
jgi:dihydrofolate reductase